VDVTPTDIARIPAENLHVSRAEFVAVWTAAERRQTEQARQHVTDWYVGGVVVTCRWLARAIVRPATGPFRPARSPVTHTTKMAHPELIEAECVAAELLDMRRPRPTWLEGRPGWSQAIVATLNWAWRRTGGPPVEVARSAAG